ncbi:dr1-associated corepressor-like isoform X2 [Argiope bruennichi]|nr:dr1-associated corepressor-like isoform X2 [Argiope bruennichi]
MQTDEDIGKVAAAVPVIISRALELFVESLVTKTSLITKSRNAKTLTTSHLKSCVLSDNSFAFLRELVASVPDVQGEDEQGTSCISDGNNSENQHARLRRPKDRGTSEDSAGPSHSTADESETWSAEEDGEEDSETSSAESSSHQQPTVSSISSASIPPSHCNVAFQTSSSHHYMSYPVPCVPNNNTSNSVDDDYDS